MASAERIAPGRLRFQITIGDREIDGRFGLPRLSAGEFGSNWELSLARAVAVAEMLARSGYSGQVVSRGFGDSRYAQLSSRLDLEQRRRLARRVDIIIQFLAESCLLSFMGGALGVFGGMLAARILSDHVTGWPPRYSPMSFVLAAVCALAVGTQCSCR